MRHALLSILAITVGFISGSLVAIYFFNPLSPAESVPTTAPSVITDCGNAGQPDCVSTIPPVPTPPTTTVPTPAATTEINFATTVTYTVGETFIYPDGLQVTLTVINDSRCKPTVQCIWAGELSPQLSLVGGDLGDTQATMLLGTASTPSQTTGAYTLALDAVTDETALIAITKKAVAIAFTPPSPVAPTPTVTSKPIVQVAGSSVTKPTNAAPTETTQTGVTFASEVAALITQATKKVRHGESFPSYTPDSALAASAKKYSSRLLAGNYLAHIDKTGCDLTCRFDESGYLADSWGENLAMMEYDEQPSAEYVANFFMTQWQKSPGHRKNLLSDTFTHQGIGVSTQNGKVYVVVHFALPD